VFAEVLRGGGNKSKGGNRKKTGKGEGNKGVRVGGGPVSKDKSAGIKKTPGTRPGPGKKEKFHAAGRNGPTERERRGRRQKRGPPFGKSAPRCLVEELKGWNDDCRDELEA